MKLQLWTLCALPLGAAAFNVQAPKATTSALSSTNPYNSGDNYFGGTQTGQDFVGTGAPLNTRGGGYDDMLLARNTWETLSPTTVQGGSLRTWSITTNAVERVQILLKTEGRPLNANVELWHGPDNTPHKMGVYVEDGSLRPFNAIVETPGSGNAIAIRNTSPLEFPLSAGVKAETVGNGQAGLGAALQELYEMGQPRLIQGGGTIQTYPFAPAVQSVQCLLKTDGRPLNSRIELLQGPNNNKQVVELYVEDGNIRPFFMILETPGSGNVIRIVNTAPVEYPLTATVEPYVVDENANIDVGPLFIVDGPSASNF